MHTGKYAIPSRIAARPDARCRTNLPPQQEELSFQSCCWQRNISSHFYQTFNLPESPSTCYVVFYSNHVIFYFQEVFFVPPFPRPHFLPAPAAWIQHRGSGSVIFDDPMIAHRSVQLSVKLPPDRPKRAQHAHLFEVEFQVNRF